jgi:uncharacterized cupredoxin-like copper-binding protein
VLKRALLVAVIALVAAPTAGTGIGPFADAELTLRDGRIVVKSVHSRYGRFFTASIKVVNGRIVAREGTIIRFHVTNRGTTTHAFRLGRERTQRLRPGADGVVLAFVGAAGRYRYVCPIDGHAQQGMRGFVRVVQAPPAEP